MKPSIFGRVLWVLSPCAFLVLVFLIAFTVKADEATTTQDVEAEGFFDGCRTGGGLLLGSYRLSTAGRFRKTTSTLISSDYSCSTYNGRFVDILHGPVIAHWQDAKKNDEGQVESHTTIGYGAGIKLEAVTLSLVLHYEPNISNNGGEGISFSPSISVSGQELWDAMQKLINAATPE